MLSSHLSTKPCRFTSSIPEDLESIEESRQSELIEENHSLEYDFEFDIEKEADDRQMLDDLNESLKNLPNLTQSYQQDIAFFTNSTVKELSDYFNQENLAFPRKIYGLILKNLIAKLKKCLAEEIKEFVQEPGFERVMLEISREILDNGTDIEIIDFLSLMSIVKKKTYLVLPWMKFTPESFTSYQEKLRSRIMEGCYDLRSLVRIAESCQPFMWQKIMQSALAQMTQMCVLEPTLLDQIEVFWHRRILVLLERICNISFYSVVLIQKILFSPVHELHQLSLTTLIVYTKSIINMTTIPKAKINQYANFLFSIIALRMSSGETLEIPMSLFDAAETIIRLEPPLLQPKFNVWIFEKILHEIKDKQYNDLGQIASVIFNLLYLHSSGNKSIEMLDQFFQPFLDYLSKEVNPELQKGSFGVFHEIVWSRMINCSDEKVRSLFLSMIKHLSQVCLKWGSKFVLVQFLPREDILSFISTAYNENPYMLNNENSQLILGILGPLFKLELSSRFPNLNYTRDTPTNLFWRFKLTPELLDILQSRFEEESESWSPICVVNAAISARHYLPQYKELYEKLMALCGASARRITRINPMSLVVCKETFFFLSDLLVYNFPNYQLVWTMNILKHLTTNYLFKSELEKYTEEILLYSYSKVEHLLTKNLEETEKPIYGLIRLIDYMIMNFVIPKYTTFDSIPLIKNYLSFLKANQIMIDQNLLGAMLEEGIDIDPKWLSNDFISNHINNSLIRLLFHFPKETAQFPKFLEEREIMSQYFEKKMASGLIKRSEISSYLQLCTNKDQIRKVLSLISSKRLLLEHQFEFLRVVLILEMRFPSIINEFAPIVSTFVLSNDTDLLRLATITTVMHKPTDFSIGSVLMIRRIIQNTNIELGPKIIPRNFKRLTIFYRSFFLNNVKLCDTLGDISNATQEKLSFFLMNVILFNSHSKVILSRIKSIIESSIGLSFNNFLYLCLILMHSDATFPAKFQKLITRIQSGTEGFDPAVYSLVRLSIKHFYPSLIEPFEKHCASNLNPSENNFDRELMISVETTFDRNSQQKLNPCVVEGVALKAVEAPDKNLIIVEISDSKQFDFISLTTFKLLKKLHPKKQVNILSAAEWTTSDTPEKSRIFSSWGLKYAAN